MATTKVVSTGTDDHLVIQAAINAASDDDTIQLEQADSSTVFQFTKGSANQVVINKALTFEGMNAPKIVGGQRTFELTLSGDKDVTIDGIEFRDTKESSIVTSNSSTPGNLTVVNNRFIKETSEGLTIAGGAGAALYE